MGTLIYGKPGPKAIRFNGTSQYAWVHNPACHTETQGAMAFWIKFNAINTVDGVKRVISLHVSDPGNNSLYIFGLRRIVNYGNSNNYLDITYRQTNGGAVYATSGSTPISAGTQLHVAFGSDGVIYLNGVAESANNWKSDHLDMAASNPNYWFGGISGSNHDLAIAVGRLAGSPSGNYGSFDMAKLLHLPGRPFTATEAAEIYAAGIGGDPALLSMYASLAPIYLFNGDGDDSIGTEDLTMVGSPTYVTP